MPRQVISDDTEVDVIESGSLVFTHYLATVFGQYHASERMVARIKDRLARYGRAAVTTTGLSGSRLLTIQLARK